MEETSYLSLMEFSSMAVAPTPPLSPFNKVFHLFHFLIFLILTLLIFEKVITMFVTLTRKYIQIQNMQRRVAKFAQLSNSRTQDEAR